MREVLSGDEGIGMMLFDYSGHKHALKTSKSSININQKF